MVWNPLSWTKDKLGGAIGSTQDFFSGGSADFSRQEQLADLARQRLLAGMEQPTGPGAQELAAQQAQRQALQRVQSQTAGMTGADAAVGARRQAMLAPVMQQAAASQAMAARAADEQARQNAIAQMFGQALGATGQLTAAEEAERQRKSSMRQAAVGGLMDIGTKAASAMGGGGGA